MSNKIGVNEYRLREIEREIVNVKLNLLNETFTFNEGEFNLDYLKKLNDFLFQDFYNSDELGLRNLSELEVMTIEFHLKSITSICKNDFNNIKDILSIIGEIGNLQPFLVGNTRTLIAFIKVLNGAFLLGLDVDVNKEITNNPNNFRLNNFVNQKRLTIHK